MKIKVGDIHKGKTSEERTNARAHNSLSDHGIRSRGSTINNVEDQYTLRSNLQIPLGIASNLISRYQEHKESNDIFAKYEAHKTRIVEILRRRLL